MKARLKPIGVFAAIFFFYGLLLVGKGLFFFSRSLKIKIRQRIVQYWSRAIIKWLNIDVIVSGTPPPPSAVLVTNHLGYMDIIVLFSILPGVFVAKSEVREWPILGGIIAGVGTLFVNRRSKSDLPNVVKRFDQVLTDGNVLIFFPEGTSTNGMSVKRFFPGLLADAANHNRNVHCGAISYHTYSGEPDARHSVCWWGDADFFPHLAALSALSGFQARIHFSNTPFNHPDRKILADRLHHEVSGLFRISGEMD